MSEQVFGAIQPGDHLSKYIQLHGFPDKTIIGTDYNKDDEYEPYVLKFANHPGDVPIVFWDKAFGIWE